MEAPGSPGRRRTARTIGATLAVCLLVAAGGCTALGTDIGPAGEDATTTRATAGTDSTTTPTTATETTASDGHSHGNATATTGAGDGQTNPTTTPADDATTTPSNRTTTVQPGGNATGRLTVVVGAEEVTAGTTVATDGFRYDAADGHTWRAAAGTTLADALASLGVEATADAVTYDGTTYRDGAANTSVDVRVNGAPVDPTTYVLRDGDEVWVTVETPGMDRATPGEYIRAADQHVHGHLHFAVNGTVVDFSADRYQSGHRHFHFEGGHADPWHAHSYGVTLAYALGTLDGIAVGDGVVTYDGTTYRDGDPDTTVRITVNGDPVDPTEYYLKDGDDVRVVVETE